MKYPTPEVMVTDVRAIGASLVTDKEEAISEILK
jgi:hypothetical protein